VLWTLFNARLAGSLDARCLKELLRCIEVLIPRSNDGEDVRRESFIDPFDLRFPKNSRIWLVSGDFSFAKPAPIIELRLSLARRLLRTQTMIMAPTRAMINTPTATPAMTPLCGPPALESVAPRAAAPVEPVLRTELGAFPPGVVTGTSDPLVPNDNGTPVGAMTVDVRSDPPVEKTIGTGIIESVAAAP
jgi:hypothetical protein